MNPLRNSPDICRRARLILAASAIAAVLLLADHFQPPTADLLPDGIPHDSVSMPIVAIRGATLADDEEALPPGALVRFGSTRFRHPVALSPTDQVAGRYLVTTGDR